MVSLKKTMLYLKNKQQVIVKANKLPNAKNRNVLPSKL